MKLTALLVIISTMFSIFGSYESLECTPSGKVSQTIRVDLSGKGNFRKIQDAIDYVPSGNLKWIRIEILPGIYRERIFIPNYKRCIFLHGAGMVHTKIIWGDHYKNTTDSNATFRTEGENILVKGIQFENTFRPKIRATREVVQTSAAYIYGDKSAFYRCSFIGLKDTLADRLGRHYYSNCRIEGAIDFIYGYARSIYEDSKIIVNVGKYSVGRIGSITAQGHYHNHPNGFVFKSCKIIGVGKAFLGRAWTSNARVIFSNTSMSDVIVPEGWDSWRAKGHENSLVFSEEGCSGPGSVKSNRHLEKTLGRADLMKYTRIKFIDSEGWIARLPH